MKKELKISLICLLIIFLSLSFVSAFSLNNYWNKITGKVNECIPNCNNKNCGNDDGCGGKCLTGACIFGQICNNGVCCTPSCKNSDGTIKKCGDNGCGGNCGGSCASFQYCENGNCIIPSCPPDGCYVDNRQYCGKNHVCENCYCETGKSCSVDGNCICYAGEILSSNGKFCKSSTPCSDSDSSIGGDFTISLETKGTCTDIRSLYNDECVVGGKIKEYICNSTTNLCNYEQDYSSCPRGTVCSNGACKLGTNCIPNCVSKTCGDNNCGGSCGICTNGQVCNNGVCETPTISCIPDCTGKQCGSNGCGGNCGTCASGKNCINNICIISTSVCTPNCGGKTCGDNGCGGTCGTCATGQTCEDNICKVPVVKTSGNYRNAYWQCYDGVESHEGGIIFCKNSNEWQLKAENFCEGHCGGLKNKCGVNSFSVENNCEIDCIPDCTGKQCSDNNCGGSCGECENGEECIDNICNVKVKENDKNMNLYYNKEVFLVSDEDWKEVLPLVSISTWPNNLNDIENSNIIMSPVLIYHSEEGGSRVDIDSIIYFMQQYTPQKLIIVGDSSDEINNLLITNAPFGAGLSSSQIIRISPSDYLNFWSSYGSVVYVEDNYELALLASTYASLLNAPLIIKGTELDQDINFENKKIICVGNVNRNCNEQYNLEQLQQKYFDKTNTDKLILINPKDWNSYRTYFLESTKTATPISKIGAKISLASPFLASAKKELIISTQNTEEYISFATISRSNSNPFFKIGAIDSDSTKIAELIHEKISKTNAKYLTIISAVDIPFKVLNEDFTDFRTYLALDPTLYADINGDKLPDISVGRIVGLTISDVSSYVARSIFYKEMLSSKKMSNAKFLASSFYTMINNANNWAEEFKNSGYNAVSSTIPLGSQKGNFDPNEWANQNLIVYGDHGNPYYAGIYSWEMPLLDNSIVFASACMTSDFEEKGGIIETEEAFRENAVNVVALSQGAMGYIGEVSAVGGTDRFTRDFINNIYYSKMNLGDSFKEAFRAWPNDMGHSSMLSGDPTLEIDVPYTLKEKVQESW